MPSIASITLHIADLVDFEKAARKAGDFALDADLQDERLKAEDCVKNSAPRSLRDCALILEVVALNSDDADSIHRVIDFLRRQ